MEKNQNNKVYISGTSHTMIVVERCVPFNTIHNFQFVLHPSAHWLTEWHTPSAEFIVWFFIISCLRCRFKNWDWIELWIVNMYVVFKQKYLPPCAWREINEGVRKTEVTARIIFLIKGNFKFLDIQILWRLSQRYTFQIFVDSYFYLKFLWQSLTWIHQASRWFVYKYLKKTPTTNTQIKFGMHIFNTLLIAKMKMN